MGRKHYSCNCWDRRTEICGQTLMLPGRALKGKQRHFSVCGIGIQCHVSEVPQGGADILLQNRTCWTPKRCSQKTKNSKFLKNDRKSYLSIVMFQMASVSQARLHFEIFFRILQYLEKVKKTTWDCLSFCWFLSDKYCSAMVLSCICVLNMV